MTPHSYLSLNKAFSHLPRFNWKSLPRRIFPTVYYPTCSSRENTYSSKNAVLTVFINFGQVLKWQGWVVGGQLLQWLQGPWFVPWPRAFRTWLAMHRPSLWPTMWPCVDWKFIASNCAPAGATLPFAGPCLFEMSHGKQTLICLGVCRCPHIYYVYSWQEDTWYFHTSL